MKVAVVGGTGSLGAPVVEALLARGDQPRVLARRPGKALPAGAEQVQADLTSGEGIAAGLDGVEAVVDASSAQRNARGVLVNGSGRLLAAEAEAEIGHHLVVSIIGCDQVPFGYYRAKVAQEQVVTEGSVPWSLLRTSQFHSLIDGFMAQAAKLRIRPTGKALAQPVDARVVAERVVTALHEGPGGRLANLAGPEVLDVTAASEAWQRARGRRLLPVRVPFIGSTGRQLRDGALCDRDAATPGATFAEWLAGR